MRRTAVIISAVLLCAAPAWAAGHTLTSPQYLAAANHVCAKANTRVKAIPSPKGHAVAAFAAYVVRELAVSVQEVRQLRALAGPEPLQTEASAVYALVAQSNDMQRRLLVAIHNRNASKAQSLNEQVDALLGRANVSADAIGLTTCGG